MVGANIVVATCLLGAGSALGYIDYRYSQVQQIDLPGLRRRGHTRVGSALEAGSAMTILLVGNNTRMGLDPGERQAFGTSAEVGGARSDVTMLLHLDPTRGASILSIPRDLFVPMPPGAVVGSVGKIDAALNNGPEKLVEAVTNDLGIPIDHYVSINFDGFQHVVDALGGIDMAFPTPMRDAYSGLNITRPGCMHLDGAAALSLVRARHVYYEQDGRFVADPQSDLSRIRRDHEFLTVLAQTVRDRGLTDPLRANAVLGNLVHQVTIDNGLSVGTMFKLLERYHRLSPSSVPQMTLPITLVSVLDYHYRGGSYGSVVFPTEPEDHEIVDAFLGRPEASAGHPTVHVVDLSGTGAGRRVARGLTQAGFTISELTSSHAPAQPVETVIRYGPGRLIDAQRVLSTLRGAAVMFADSQVPPGSIVLDVGSVIAVSSPTTVLRPGAPSPTGAIPAPGTLTTTSTTVPTPGNAPISSAETPLQSFDPVACH